MKKQYRISDSTLFKRTVKAYCNGELISSETLWEDDVCDYVEDLEEDGYVYGYTQDEVDEAKELYEHRLANLIGGEKNDL